MKSRIVLERSSARFPALDATAGERPLEIVVPFTNAALTACALAAADALAHGMAHSVTLLAVHVLPFPAPLECHTGIRRHLETELQALARTCSDSIRIQLVFARDRWQAYQTFLRPKSLVVIGTNCRWWRTREECFAHKLAANGHSVAVIRVN